ncbi:helix-turn-helix domain-containing protein [Micromonospora globispora]|nr:helix-turn-helix domain-containing protein [Micromonospora globispora]
MTSVGVPEVFARRPKRADARRNYEALVAAAREAFGERGTSASLEEIARRAQVGIGTLYRHFPTRQELLEAVYVDEVEALCRSAAELADLPPWDAFVA